MGVKKKIVSNLGFSLIFLFGFLFSTQIFAEPADENNNLVNFPMPSISDVVLPIPLDRQTYLNQFYPKVPVTLAPLMPEYPWEEMGVTELMPWHYALKDVDLETYTRIADNLNQQLQSKEHIDYEMEKYYLLADIYFNLSINGKTQFTDPSIQAYTKAIEKFPNSLYEARASYQLALINLRAKDFNESTRICLKHQVGQWEKYPEWVKLFRDLLMETYYLRGRYIKVQDFLWFVANSINKDELTPILALRYGDSLFWDGRYPEAVDWYEKVTDLLNDPNSELARYSRIYYAESLFQIKRDEEALALFLKYKETDAKKEPTYIVDYRIAALHILANKAEAANAILRDLLLSPKHPQYQLALAARLQLVRMVLNEPDIDKKLIKHPASQKYRLGTFLAEFKETQYMDPLVKEALYVIGLIQWNMGKKNIAVETIYRIMSQEIYKEKAEKFNQEVSDALLLMLTEISSEYFEKKDYLGYLKMVEKVNMAIWNTSFPESFLFRIGNLYEKIPLYSAAARIYQRVLFDFKPNEIQQKMLKLHLAYVYSETGENELAEKVMSEVGDIPDNESAKKMALLAEASIALKKQNYAGCLQSYIQFLQMGVKGTELFKYSLAAAQCARLANNYATALKYLELLGITDDQIIFDNNSKEIYQFQMLALTERFKTYNAMKQYEQVTRLYEKIAASTTQQISWQLDSMFAVIDAYIKQHKPDVAMALWQEFSKNNKNIPDNFKSEYEKYLQLQSELELVPHRVSS